MPGESTGLGALIPYLLSFVAPPPRQRRVDKGAVRPSGAAGRNADRAAARRSAESRQAGPPSRRVADHPGGRGRSDPHRLRQSRTAPRTDGNAGAAGPSAPPPVPSSPGSLRARHESFGVFFLRSQPENPRFVLLPLPMQVITHLITLLGNRIRLEVDLGHHQGSALSLDKGRDQRLPFAALSMLGNRHDFILTHFASSFFTRAPQGSRKKIDSAICTWHKAQSTQPSSQP